MLELQLREIGRKKGFFLTNWETLKYKKVTT
jgi:hypothetical protein